MANIKISELNETTSLNNNDLIPIIDTTASETKKITKENFMNTTSIIDNEYGTSTSKGYSQNYINQCNTYSTSEVNTGKTWIDGKPIYRKVFTSPDVNYGTTQTIDLGITTIDSIIKTDGYVQRYTAGASSLSGNYYSINNKYTDIFIKKSTGILTMSITTEYVHFAQGNCYIEYTKTTD